ncbi:MAG: response regulator [Desulfobulbaceae bacterium]|nr:response regulator [Desulfobulbaceae bacterium]
MKSHKEPEKKILIADDNQDSRELIIKILKKNGYRIIEAVDGEDAYNKIRLERPQMVLMDISMPKINGYELARMVKSSGDFKDTLIVAVTAHAMKGDKDAALAAGCIGYITKPINVREFHKQIKQYFNS